MLACLQEGRRWDLAVIGGGATGLGIAVDAAARGLSVVLFEAGDFARGTSSRSTKLVHGGVRYLAQGALPMVFSALRERGRLARNAPHLVRTQSFVIPCYSTGEKIKYITGLKLYDWLSGPLSLGASRLLSRTAVEQKLPGIRMAGLTGGVQYTDAQFDDARLAINLAQTAAEQGAVLLNYCPVTALTKDVAGRISGLTAADAETGRSYTIGASAVINATGVFTDKVVRFDQPDSAPLVRPSQGVHLVLDRSFLPGDTALLIPETSDGRVLFLIPWKGYVVAGTTDTPLNDIAEEPVAAEEEITFILETVRRYLSRPPERSDVRSLFAGLRPLAAEGSKGVKTAGLSRDHRLHPHPSGLLTVTGGKWTTYRKMAADAVNAALELAGLPARPGNTVSLPIHGHAHAPTDGHLNVYGSDAAAIEALWQEVPGSARPLLPELPHTEAEVLHAIRHEMAVHVEDVLARRLRLLFLDARAALRAAPRVAELMQQELQRTEEWKEAELRAFAALAAKYLPGGVNGSMGE
ncbi:MAG TPA: glycerol-3-phosphate dehydrogenase/oxidase [Chitinophagaceae bacterium]|jgi:glycerol-3-phosphate dehydrogenase|nr:glycerol-3-phosphate dehydrogenase/oxidase [Chitinophagaceae bacterium]